MLLHDTQAVSATLSAAATLAVEPSTSGEAATDAPPLSRPTFSFTRWAAGLGLSCFAHLIAEADLADFIDTCMTPLTIFAPTDEAVNRLDMQGTGHAEVLRELLCVHLTMGHLDSSELRTTRSLTTIGQQTHHITPLSSSEGRRLQVGPATLLQNDVMLPDGRGVLHTIDCVMCCLRLLQHCRHEQVWNKTVRPSPKVAIHGEWNHQRDELHAILIHCDSWHPLMQGLRGHAIALAPPTGSDKGHKSFQKSVAHFSELLILEKPPEMSKKKRRKCHENRAGENGPSANYRVMFSLYRKDQGTHGKAGEERGKHLTFVMAPEDVLIRNSFHMLSEEEKHARRIEYKELTKHAESKQSAKQFKQQRVDGAARKASGGSTSGHGAVMPSLSLAHVAKAAEAAHAHALSLPVAAEDEDDGVTPRLIALSVTTGAYAGGTWVWIQGRSFSPDTRIYVGANLAHRMMFVSDCLVQISTPPATPSTGTVEVRASSNGGLGWSNELHYTYSIPGPATLSPMESELMERQLVLLQHFVQACCGSGAEASVHQLMARDLAQPQRLLGAVLALILAGSGGLNHKGSALDLERQDPQGCTLMHYICSLRNSPALQLLLRANVDPNIADSQGLNASDWAHAYGFPDGVRQIEQHTNGAEGGRELVPASREMQDLGPAREASSLDAFLQAGRTPKLPLAGEGGARVGQPRSLQQFLQPAKVSDVASSAAPAAAVKLLEAGSAPQVRSQELHHRSLAGFLTAAAAHVESTRDTGRCETCHEDAHPAKDARARSAGSGPPDLYGAGPKRP